MINGDATIGIVGGGQLGRMLTLAAKPMGFKVVVVDPNENCPAAKVGAKQIKASLYNTPALRRLAKQSDVITVEIEHLDAKTLASIEKLGNIVHPSPKTIELIQDKFNQKQFFVSAGIATGPFEVVNDRESALRLLKRYKKMLLKKRFGAYDGRGNILVTNKRQLDLALKRLSGEKLYAEEYVPFTKELAIMVARAADGKIALYPLVETRHLRNICVEVLAPARVSPDVQSLAQNLAKKVAKNLSGAGVYGIEMFLTKKGEVLLNEVAPRVHNSGHYTIEGCATSQFTQHIRAICGLPLGSTQLLYPAVVMVNILGQRNGAAKPRGLYEALKVPGVSVHMYGKTPTKIDRKMGHITAIGETIEEASRRANQARRRIEI